MLFDLRSFIYRSVRTVNILIEFLDFSGYLRVAYAESVHIVFFLPFLLFVISLIVVIAISFVVDTYLYYSDSRKFAMTPYAIS